MVPLNIELPEHFLEEEVRCGYTVSSEMKKLWAVQLDILAEIDRVCKKYGIVYFASGGTLLGAIRHDGFIPWDDDIDIMMLRSEYDRLCAVASEFEHPYFFQTEYTDPGSLRPHAQVRRSDTTGILKWEYKGRYPFNQGIFVDIFPLDNVTPDEAAREAQFREVAALKEKYQKIANMTDLYYPSPVKGRKFAKAAAHAYYSLLPKKKRDYSAIFSEMEQACKRYNGEETEMIACIGFIAAMKNFRHHIKYRADYLEAVPHKFEFMEIPVCKGYEHALTCFFGNWKEFVVGTANHDDMIVDTDRPYTEYLKK